MKLKKKLKLIDYIHQQTFPKLTEYRSLELTCQAWKNSSVQPDEDVVIQSIKQCLNNAGKYKKY